jgi:alpha-ketoglutarate-dependent taurine dioxygenase
MTQQRSTRTPTPTTVAAAPEERWNGPVIVPAERREPLTAWAAGHRPWIDEALKTHGAILFRGFAIDGRENFQQAAAALCDRLLDYVYRSTPRTTAGERIYTATEYRADANIPFHNENAYQRDWPMKLVFCCLQPARSGGETGLASMRGVTRRLDPEMVERFAKYGVMYVRNYHDGMDLSWRETFQTERREDVEAYCRRESIACEWVTPEHLRTRQICQGAADHPVTGERLWFNQAQLFHVSSLGDADAEGLLEVFEESGLPRHAYFGDGSPIDRSALDAVRAAFDAEAFLRPWEAGDVLLVDNMLVAHARSPFEGPREVLVAMGDAHSEVVARMETVAGRTRA